MNTHRGKSVLFPRRAGVYEPNRADRRLGDLITYPVACTCEDHPDESLAISRAHKSISDILEATQANEYKIFLTGPNNFRKKINKEYKANRKDKPLPLYLNTLREYLVKEWNAQVTDGFEADDALGIENELHRANNDDVIVCSFDKDLDQLTGSHYNWNKAILYQVSELEGIRHFYKQMLIGDRSDNIFGIKGIGTKRADDLLNHINTEPEMIDIVYPLYDSNERFEMNGDCLWILRKDKEFYTTRNSLYVR